MLLGCKTTKAEHAQWAATRSIRFWVRPPKVCRLVVEILFWIFYTAHHWNYITQSKTTKHKKCLHVIWKRWLKIHPLTMGTLAPVVQIHHEPSHYSLYRVLCAVNQQHRIPSQIMFIKVWIVKLPEDQCLGTDKILTLFLLNKHIMGRGEHTMQCDSYRHF